MNTNKLYFNTDVLEDKFNSLYGEVTDEQKARYKAVFEGFKREFDENSGYFASSPGRVEICGNHTDHNGGVVMSSAISLDTLAVFTPRNDKKAEIYSEGYGKMEIEFDKEFSGKIGTSDAMVYGVAQGLINHGYNVGGFNAYVSSNVLGGAGISSSASFELLVVEILNFLYNDGRINKSEKAIIAQYSEREFFGKPCGLLDQTAISYGGLKRLDFSVKGEIKVDDVNNDLSDYTLILINTGGSHENLTDEYAAVPKEMFDVAKAFDKERLIDLDKDIFFNAKDKLDLPIRAIKRAEHFYEENERVNVAFDALNKGDNETFIKAVNGSGESSLYKLQNCFVESFPERPIVDALNRAKEFILDGACRVHGGGFAGTTLNIVKNQNVQSFVDGLSKYYDKKDLILLKVRKEGAIVL